LLQIAARAKSTTNASLAFAFFFVCLSCNSWCGLAHDAGRTTRTKYTQTTSTTATARTWSIAIILQKLVKTSEDQARAKKRFGAKAASAWLRAATTEPCGPAQWFVWRGSATIAYKQCLAVDLA
jgi:hypothetical protein